MSTGSNPRKDFSSPAIASALVFVCVAALIAKTVSQRALLPSWAPSVIILLLLLMASTLVLFVVRHYAIAIDGRAITVGLLQKKRVAWADVDAVEVRGRPGSRFNEIVIVGRGTRLVVAVSVYADPGSLLQVIEASLPWLSGQLVPNVPGIWVRPHA
jgi:hypothetical protein